MKGVSFYKLKGINGWSWFDISTIDVSKIIEMQYFKRFSCIFNRDYPYMLHIDYNEPTTALTILPGFGFDGSFATMITFKLRLTQNITKRYKTEKEVMQEIKNIQIEEIKNKQYHLDLLKSKLEDNNIYIQK